MRLSLALPAVALLALSGCARLHFYPIAETQAGKVSPEPIPGRIGGLVSGTITLWLPGGEICRGPWVAIGRGQTDTELAAAWDTLYGSGYYTAHVLGALKGGKGRITGDRGSVFQVAFYMDTVKDSPLLGVARDQSGRLYKVTW